MTGNELEARNVALGLPAKATTCLDMEGVVCCHRCHRYDELERVEVPLPGGGVQVFVVCCAGNDHLEERGI